MNRGWAAIAAVTLGLMSTGASCSADAIDFSRDIRPILSDNCFACHGPDEGERQGGFRLDQRDSSLGAADSGERPIVPGDAGASELIRRIASQDESLRMPPADGHKALSAEEIDLLTRWVAAGAEWQQHWALVAPTSPALPTVRNERWPRNEIDRFVLTRLESEGLSPAPEADRASLLRRASLDLTGLPPTPAELDAFLYDNQPGAYERVVERLLASPRYGEHMARFWLDAARYGDTHGLHLDNYREMWPYRDWVVRMFNADQPFDQFLVEQLAGDLLPTPSEDQLIATGFSRNHVTTAEGGSIVEEVDMRNVVDRVETFGTVFLGLTIGCARCHDHKYDPISMRDFYSLYAYFNSLDGNPMDENRKDPAPVLRVATAAQKSRLAELDGQIATAESRLAEDWPELDAQQAAWEEQFALMLAHGQSADEESSSSSAAEKKSFLAVSDWHWVGPFSDSDRYLRSRRHGPEGKPIDLAEKYKLPTGEKIGWVKRPEWVDGSVHNDLPGNPAANFLYRTITVARRQPLEISLGSNDGIRVYLNGKEVLKNYVDRTAAPDQEKVTLNLRRGENQLLVKIVNFSGTSGFYFAVKTELPTMPPEVLAALAVPAAERAPEQAMAIRQFYRNGFAASPELDKLRADLAAARAARAQIDGEVATTLIWRETAEPKPAFMLTRGEYDQRGEPVERRTPAALPPMDAAMPNDRLGLAQWAVAPTHPLTARVAVNRFWQQAFGTGLVKTAEDFGSQGEPPRHPELLDWLATDFMADQWNVKNLMRRIVTSATYRQGAHVRPELYARDPENRLLARGTRLRLDAETLRDQALFVGGLLVEQLGGPSVKPPQPAGLWEAVGYSGSNTVKFVADAGPEKVHRRTLYTFIKRTAPPPEMNTFDAPSRESCTVRRERTNTPLQALLLLNDPQYVEAARGLAVRTIREGGDDVAARATFMLRTALVRDPTGEEVADLAAAYEDELAHYQANAEAAVKLAAVGQPMGAVVDPAELAAWTVTANIVLNLDEVITKN
jgi:hypothetical protein